MIKATNVPYRYTEENKVTAAHPYQNDGTNRASRRQKDKRFLNNRAGHQLTVVGNTKYRRFVQIIDNKTIYHYLSA
jgi:hypothetical protein